MSTTKTTITGAIAALGLLAATAAAFAAPANATTAVNVRSGPGTGFGVVDTLVPGEAVDVTECAANGWCHIQHPGPDGWVSAKYLVADLDDGPAIEDSEDPDVNFGFGFDSNGNFSFGVGIGGDPVLPAPPAPPAPEVAKVCFFNGNNYTGASFCVSPGATENHIGGFWNDKISSIQLTGGASVKVCQNFNYGGFCNTFGASRAVLGGPLNNKVSSFKAY